MEDPRPLYRARFGEDVADRVALWKVLCQDYFQALIDPGDTVLDVGAGYCEFINNIQARRRIAVDLNEDILTYAASGVEAFATTAECLPLANGEADVVFSSNFLEHMLDKATVLSVLQEMRRVTRPGGLLVLLQPNIRYAYKEYWDFFDHYTPLSDKSMAEALTLAGFRPIEIIPRFLPYTTKSRLPQSPALATAYLRLRPLWRIFGKQMLIRARAEEAS